MQHQQRDITARGAIFALIATAIWSGNYIIARAMPGQIPPVTLACLRWGVAFLFLLPFCLKPLAKEWADLKSHWRYYILTALTGIIIFNTFIYIAGKNTAALNMALIAATSPIFTILLARIFLKEPMGTSKLIGIIAALTGVLLLAVQGDLSRLLELQFHVGDLLILIGAISFAGYNIQIIYKPPGASPKVFMLVMFGLGFVILAPFSGLELAFGKSPLHLTITSIGSTLYLALGTSIASYWLWNKAIASMGPGNCSLFYYTLPFFSGIEAVVLLGEKINWVHAASGGLILAGIAVATKKWK